MRRLPLLPTLLLAGCTLPADEGLRLRRQVAELEGQPAAPLIAELGEPGRGPVASGGERLTWGMMTMVFGRRGGGRECHLEVDVDAEGRVVDTALRGSNYACGEMAIARRQRARYERAHPDWRERAEALSQELVDARRRLREAADPE